MSSLTTVSPSGITHFVDGATFEGSSRKGTANLHVYYNSIQVLFRRITATRGVVEETTVMKVSDIVDGSDFTTSFSFTTQYPHMVRYDKAEIDSAIAEVKRRLQI